MYIDYVGGNNPEGVKEQHNIMVLVGNGFDISVLKKYRRDKLVSSYSKFYDYLCYKDFNKSNVLFGKMVKDKEEGKKNWSDFECSLGELIEKKLPDKVLDYALKEIQDMFLLFLNEIVNPELLLKLNEDAEANHWGAESLSKFLEDLCEEDYKKISFPNSLDHHHMYNYLIVNFNYTSLLDNYIFLDKEQFDPHKHKTIDTNFTFYPDPNLYKKVRCNTWENLSSFLIVNTIHPHGYQNIPRSLLFGIENQRDKSERELNRFNKSYWAQNDQKYRKYFDDTRLFIIYGTSIGETDSWWWANIYNSLLKKNSELIIYYYNANDCSSDEIKQMFIASCKISESEETNSKVKAKIYVILHKDKNHKMFSLGDKNLHK